MTIKRSLIDAMLATSRPAGREQAHDLPVALAHTECVLQGHSMAFVETYTIIQRNEHDSWVVVDVCNNLHEASKLCAHYCDAAGVARTMVLNSIGTCVCVES